MWRKNVGPLDRAIRLAGGTLILALGVFTLSGLQGRVVGLVVAAFGLWFMVTGAIGRCPLYVLLGISTLREEPAAPRSDRAKGSVSAPSRSRPRAA